MSKGATFTNAAIQEMAQKDVQALIGDESYKNIRAKDPHPLFVALSLAHEGKSFGRIIGRRGAERGAEKIWPRSIIHELVSRINNFLNPAQTIAETRNKGRKASGIPVYLFHNHDNSPRNPVGRLVAAVSRHIRGRVHALGIAYISDTKVREKIHEGELDTCSIEAELEFQSQPSGSSGRKWIVNAVRKITGVALGSRALQKPGFEGAGILAAVQEFDTDLDDSPERLQVLEMEKRLEEREKEIQNLEAEVQRLKDKAESNQKTEKVMKLAEKFMGGANISPVERTFILDDLKELSRSFGNNNGELETQVAGRVKRQLERMEQMRRYYSSTVSIPAPPERGPENPTGESGGPAGQGILSNPLIPRN